MQHPERDGSLAPFPGNLSINPFTAFAAVHKRSTCNAAALCPREDRPYPTRDPCTCDLYAYIHRCVADTYKRNDIFPDISACRGRQSGVSTTSRGFILDFFSYIQTWLRSRTGMGGKLAPNIHGPSGHYQTYGPRARCPPLYVRCRKYHVSPLPPTRFFVLGAVPRAEGDSRISRGFTGSRTLRAWKNLRTQTKEGLAREELLVRTGRGFLAPATSSTQVYSGSRRLSASR